MRRRISRVDSNIFLDGQASNTEGNLEYRRLLIRALHACTGAALFLIEHFKSGT